MIGEWWLLLAGVVGGVALGLGIDRVRPGLVRRRHRARVDREGAVWVGPANFFVDAPGQHPVVAAAFVDVGAYFGESFAPHPSPRAVDGVLWVWPDRVSWEPNRYLGRGEARRWEIPLDDIASVEISTSRFQRAGIAVMRTVDGSVRCGVGDVVDFRDRLNRLLASSPRPVTVTARAETLAAAERQERLERDGQEPSVTAARRMRIATWVSALILFGSVVGAIVGFARSTPWLFSSSVGGVALSASFLLELRAIVWFRTRRRRLAVQEAEDVDVVTRSSPHSG